MKTLAALLALALPQLGWAALHVTVVEGLPGNADYQQRFDEEVTALTRAVSPLVGDEPVTVLKGDGATREAILMHLKELSSRLGKDDRLALFLVGHGSYDEVNYKFNVPGPDVTAKELASALDAVPTGAQLLVNFSSASGAAQEILTSPSRIVISATRSGNERNAPRFGQFFTEALASGSADVDKNGDISAQEAFDYAARQVEDYYKDANQLATEHPQLAGDMAPRFRIARLPGAEPETASNPQMAALLARRQALDDQIDALRLRQSQMDPGEYLEQLQSLLVQMANVENQLEAAGGEAEPSTAPASDDSDDTDSAGAAAGDDVTGIIDQRPAGGGGAP